MKTKLEMAHDYAVAMLRAGVTKESATEFAQTAFVLVDAMQAEAEADKRTTEVIVSYASKEFHNKLEVLCKKEWQPDWSQAPEWANWWAMDGDKKTRWIYSELEQPYISDMFLRWFAIGRFNSEDAPSFNYTGDWRDSLRKRPN